MQLVYLWAKVMPSCSLMSCRTGWVGSSLHQLYWGNLETRNQLPTDPNIPQGSLLRVSRYNQSWTGVALHTLSTRPWQLKTLRHVEFARAAATSIFDNTLPQAHYLGFVKKENYSKTQEALSELVYAHWDQSDESGPKARPRSENNNEPIGLKILAMVNGTVVWPDSLGTRFPAGSMEHKELEKKRLDFVAKYPQPAGDTVQPARPTQTARSTARPDFSIDNGALPLDPTRVVDLAGVSASDFTAERWGVGSNQERKSWIQS